MAQHAYRGRRIFQSVIALIGFLIIAMAVHDLTRADPLSDEESQFESTGLVEDLNRLMDENIGRVPIDLMIFALGAWIAFFGLDGVLHRGPQLSFDESGIRYFRFGRQTIPWEAIEKINFIQRRRTSLLRSAALDIELKDPAPVARQQPYLYRGFRRTLHMFDPNLFTIHGYDIEVPLLLVAQEMQKLVEPELANGDDDEDRAQSGRA